MPSVTDHWYATRVIDAMYRGESDNALLRIINQHWEVYDGVNSLRGLSTCGRISIAYSVRLVGGSVPDKLVFVTGLESRDNLVGYLRGFLDSGLMVEHSGCNVNVFHDSVRVFRSTGLVGVGLDRPIQFYGHSAGGALCEALAVGYGSPVRFPLRSIVTYGAPKLGYASCYNNLPGVDRVRYMADDDPIPLVPCVYLTQSGSIALVLGASASRLQQRRPSGGVESEPWRCVHPHGGMRLANGAAVSALLPRFGVSSASALQQWILGEEPAVSAHSIGNYRDQLHLVDDPVDWGRRGAPEPQPAVNFVLPLEPREINLVLPLVLTVRVPGPVAVGADGTFLVATQHRSSSMTQTRLKPFLRFAKMKVGGEWKVTLMGALVATCANRSKANTLTKWGNKWLRTMGNQSTIHNNSMVDSLTNWFSAASTPGAGASPPIIIGGD